MINILTVGKINKKFYRQAIDDYKKRIGAYHKINEIQLNESKLTPKNEQEITQVIEEESNLILKNLKGYVIVLDRSGKEITSEKIASTINNNFTRGNSEITFVIGGSYGMNKDVLAKADLIVSFGKITFPHQLMRVVLFEQVYRAFSILNNSKYHK